MRVTPLRPGQRWRNKMTGQVLTLGQRVNSKNWRVTTGRRRTHRIFEGRLRQHYELLLSRADPRPRLEVLR